MTRRNTLFSEIKTRCVTNINDSEIILSKQKIFITKIFDFYQMHLHVVQRAKLIRKGKYILYLQKGII